LSHSGAYAGESAASAREPDPDRFETRDRPKIARKNARTRPLQCAIV